MKKILYSFIFIILAISTLNAQDDILFRKYIVRSGFHGLFYGAAIDVIGELDGGAAAGIPVLTAGVSAVLPLLTVPSKEINFNSLVLSGHGKGIGWAHGFALATLIGGENALLGIDSAENSNNYKLTIGGAALTSIGLGMVGRYLGKNKDWSEGQVSLYRHYGWVMPFTGFSIMASFSDEPRLFGGSVLLFGAGSYFLADMVNNSYNYTRGEVRATQVLAALNFGLGWGIFADLSEDEAEEGEFSNTNWLIPAAGLLGGTLAGHLWTKNTNLTSQQGWYTAYAAAGGAVIGLGVALIIDSEEVAPWYLIPYGTGMGAYAYAIERFRKNNQGQGFLPEKKKNNWDFAFMPQNLFVNARMNNKAGQFINGKYYGMQPLFAASVKF